MHSCNFSYEKLLSNSIPVRKISSAISLVMSEYVNTCNQFLVVWTSKSIAGPSLFFFLHTSIGTMLCQKSLLFYRSCWKIVVIEQKQYQNSRNIFKDDFSMTSLISCTVWVNCREEKKKKKAGSQVCSVFEHIHA